MQNRWILLSTLTVGLYASAYAEVCPSASDGQNPSALEEIVVKVEGDQQADDDGKKKEDDEIVALTAEDGKNAKRKRIKKKKLKNGAKKKMVEDILASLKGGTKGGSETTASLVSKNEDGERAEESYEEEDNQGIPEVDLEIDGISDSHLNCKRRLPELRQTLGPAGVFSNKKASDELHRMSPAVIEDVGLKNSSSNSGSGQDGLAPMAPETGCVSFGSCISGTSKSRDHLLCQR
jgi:hypothetical protein